MVVSVFLAVIARALYLEFVIGMYSKILKQEVVATIGVLLLMFIVVFLHATNPGSVGPLGVLVFFVALYVMLVCALFLALTAIHSLVLKFAPPGKTRQLVEPTSTLKRYYYSSVIALAPIILIGMQSVGGVRLFDVVLVLLFEIFAIFYTHRRF